MADYKQLATEKLSALPIAKHLTDIKSEINGEGKKWRKGEFTIFSILTILAVIIGGGLFTVFAYKLLIGYLLPIIGKMAQYVVVGATLAACYFMWPLFKRFIKNISTKISKKLIADDPFGELYNQLNIMQASKKNFVESRGKVSQLKTNLKIEAEKKAQDATEFQEKITVFTRKAAEAKAIIEQLKPSQVEGDEDDAYIQALNDYDTNIAAAQRAESMYNQNNLFAQKFADRGAILSKLDKKLSRVANRIDIKIEDFKQTIIMLKNEYDVAHNLRTATDAAKSALVFDNRWELDYALDVITETISVNLATTAANLQDIDLTTGLLLGDTDNDAAFAKLETLANKISSGESTVVNVDKYNSPTYKRTESDKKVNPSFGDYNF